MDGPKLENYTAVFEDRCEMNGNFIQIPQNILFSTGKRKYSNGKK